MNSSENHPRLLSSPSSDKHIPQLDGVRGLAIFLVLLAHFYFSMRLPPSAESVHPFIRHLFYLAWSGVDLFFVLSGFLIGRILMEHTHSKNYFLVFYVRRICRILPIYLLLLALCVWGASHSLENNQPLLLWNLQNSTTPLWSFLTFTHNFYMAEYGVYGPKWLGITWSLAIEEQFYLILPLIIYRTKPSLLPYLLILLILGAPLFRMFIVALTSMDSMATFFLLPARMDELLMGVFGAWFMNQPKFVEHLKQKIWFLYSLFLIFGGTVFIFSWQKTPPGSLKLIHFGYTSIAFFYLTLILIGLISTHSLIQKFYTFAPLRYLGIISYFVYLYHFAIHEVFYFMGYRKFFPESHLYDPLSLLLGLACLLSAGVISWNFLEKPFIKLGHRLKY